jgi:MFS family permease
MSKQILLLFLGKWVLYSAAAGLLSLLPIYATQLKATPQFIGNYLAVIYLCLSFGTFLAGWLVSRWQRYQPILCGAALGFSAALLLMSRVQTLWQLVGFTAIAWFFAGMGLALTSIITGLSIGARDRGKAFSWLEMVQGLGALLGGLSAGRLADQWGYGGMVMAIAGFSLLWFVTGLGLKEPQADEMPSPAGVSVVSTVGADSRASESGKQPLPLVFYGLLLATVMANLIQSVDALARPLLMNSLGFKATEISAIATTAIVGTLLLPLVGWLGDRSGKRYGILFISCAIATVGMLASAQAVQFWHFWLTAALVNVSLPLFSAVGNAIIADVVPRHSLPVALSTFGSSIWLTATLGFTVAGYLIEQVGTVRSFGFGALLPVVSGGLLLLARSMTPPDDPPDDSPDDLTDNLTAS